MKISNNKILVTGGASGIGLGLAEGFIKEHNTVIICGRREETLQEAKRKFPSLITQKCDLAVPAEREQLFQWISKEHPDLNVLVNNAGSQNWMSLTDAEFYQRAHDEIVINIEAPIHLISLFQDLKSLNAIINVSSGLAYVPIVKAPVYSASKAFVHSFTWSLRSLLKSRNIEIIELLPPALNTDLGGKGIHDHFPPVSGFIEAVFAQLKAGKTEITYGFTVDMVKAGPEDLQNSFNRMNPVTPG
jgi:uncharacterized oxidoreductase